MRSRSDRYTPTRPQEGETSIVLLTFTYDVIRAGEPCAFLRDDGDVWLLISTDNPLGVWDLIYEADPE